MKIDENEGTTSAAENTPPIALRFAPAWKRVLSYIIDSIILFLILAIFILTVYHKELFQLMNATVGSDFKKFSDSTMDSITQSVNSFINSHILQIIIARLVIEASYFSLSWSGGGQTIGGRIMKIFVMTLERKRLSILQGIVRYIIIYLTGLAFYILQIVLFNRVYQQRIHDFFTGSVVVEVPVIKPSEGGKQDGRLESSDRTD